MHGVITKLIKNCLSFLMTINLSGKQESIQNKKAPEKSEAHGLV
jgi:hypothetical protein